MSEVMNQWGMTSDNDSSLEPKQGGVFGLNCEAHVTKFEFNPNAGKDGVPGAAIDITVKVGDRDYMKRVFDISRLWYKGDEVQPGQEGYEEAYKAEQTQKQAMVVHYLKSFGVTEDQIKNTLQAGNVTDFKSWCIAMTSLAPANYQTIPVDVFLQYQYSIREGQSKTYLELPNNMKSGKFIFPAVKPVGEWKPVEKNGGLIFVDNTNNEHPCFKTQAFMESPVASEQKEGDQQTQTASNPMMQGGAAPANGTTAQSSVW